MTLLKETKYNYCPSMNVQTYPAFWPFSELRSDDISIFLFLRVDSIHIKGNFFNKSSNKSCTFLHVRMFFCSLLFFISMTLLVLSGDIETNPGPELGYSNSFSYCYIASLPITFLRCLYCKLTTPYVSLILSVNQKPI